MSSNTNATGEQVEMHLDFMQEHQDLARGRLLRDVEGRARARREWMELTTTLNGLEGSIKTIKQWQKEWADKKYAAKKAAAGANLSASATGGGPASAPPLSGVDYRIAAIMGEGYGLPATTAYVNAFPQHDIENLTPNVPMETINLPVSGPVLPVSELELPALGSELTVSVQLPGPSSASSGLLPEATGPCRRRLTQPLNFRAKLLKIEEERLEEIKAIRAAVETISTSVTAAAEIIASSIAAAAATLSRPG